jgi:hypothetical protein
MMACSAHIAAVAAVLPSTGTTPREIGRTLPDVPPSSLRSALRALVLQGQATFTGEMGKRLYSRREPAS